MSHNNTLEEHILNYVQKIDIREQSELQKLLKDRGFDIPQATLSRRLKKLNIAKIGGIYKIIELKRPNLPVVLNIQVSEFGLIVLHTHPGNANNLALFIDQKYVTLHPQHPKEYGILGTIAGDDTVLIIVKGKEDIDKVLKLLKEAFSIESLT